MHASASPQSAAQRDEQRRTPPQVTMSFSRGAQLAVWYGSACACLTLLFEKTEAAMLKPDQVRTADGELE